MSGQTQKSTAKTRLALRYRLPNPPPVFVGRAALVAWMQRAIERAPVTAVWGLGGMGKTALVLSALHQHFGEALERTIFIGSRPSDAPGDVRVEVVRALSQTLGEEDIDWVGLSGNPEALTMTALDLAEEGELFVVLDDLHYEDPTIAHDLLTQMARYARRSRWIVTSRVDPKLTELPEQVLPIPTMTAAELAELASACAPAATNTENAVAAAAGSPWRLRQLLAGGESSSIHTDVLTGTPPEALAFLEALSLLQLALPLETVARLATIPNDASLAALRDRGVIERTPNGWRLHDVARPLVRSALSSREPRARDAAELLARSPEPLAALESLRLHLSHDGIDAAADLLASRGEALLSAGHTHEVWPLIARVEDPRFAHWQLRCATELGHTDAALAVAIPAPESPADLLLRARCLFRTGKRSEALEGAEAAVERAHDNGDARVAFEASLVQKDCLSWLGRTEEGLSILDALVPPDEETAILREAYVAAALSEADRFAESTRRVAAIVPALRTAFAKAGTKSIARESARQAARALDLAGHLRGELELLDLAHSSSSPASYVSRAVMLQRIACLTGMGRLADVERALEGLSRFAADTPMQHLYELCFEMEKLLAEGNVRQLEQTIPEFEAASEACAYRDALTNVAIYRLHIATLRAEEAPAREAPDARVEPSAHAKRALRAVAALYDARRGAIDPSTTPRDEESGEARILSHLAAAHVPLFADDAKDAAARAKSAGELADELGWGVLRAESLQLLCDCAIIAELRADAARAAAELARAAEAMPSPRFAADARLANAIASDSPLDLVLLEELIALSETAPLAARRASLLLGNDEMPADRVDELLIAAVVRAHGARVTRVGGAPATTARFWLLDDGAMDVWLPGGRRVSLRARRRDWRILSTLAERGGRATKEELVRGVWRNKTYHPLRDDKRLQIAIRRLRLLIEDDASNPTRIVTLEDGYAFGDRETVHRRAPIG